MFQKENAGAMSSPPVYYDETQFKWNTQRNTYVCVDGRTVKIPRTIVRDESSSSISFMNVISYKHNTKSQRSSLGAYVSGI